jgi:hypothetical protein
MESLRNEGQETPSLAQIAVLVECVADDDLLDYEAGLCRHSTDPVEEATRWSTCSWRVRTTALAAVDVGAFVSLWRCDPPKAGSLRTGVCPALRSADHK